jgi:type II secretory pathway component GspD/PulD (secretin)
MPRKTAEERTIERKLSSPVNLNFTNAPLRQVIDDLRAFQGVNIYVDAPALAEKGISEDQPVSIKLENIALKSALNLLLHNLHLTYVIQDDVLQITTEDHARGKLERQVYAVPDLVIAVPNFDTMAPPAEMLGLQTINHMSTPAPSPVTGPFTLPNGQQTGAPMGGSMANGGSFAAEAMAAAAGPQVVKSRSHTNEDALIKLITSTIQPRSWAEMGGPGTIDYFPLTSSLVINQTPDIQDQVADLLAALRRLQDNEVAVEVKFISIAEDFFERIGVNFNLNIVNKQATHFQPQLTSGNFQQPGFINQFAPGRFISGLTPAGTLTSDLNIPITTNTYNMAIPPFGGYPGVPGFGGVTLGLAFLSDIQVFLFMEAVQGDIRSNVMQAPKLTLFNGQTATITILDFQFFVLGVTVIPQFGQFTYFPATTLAPLGITLTVQAVMTADRRFVRMSLTPTLSNLVNGEVNLFPVVTPIFPLFDGTATGQPVVFTQFVQQPRLTRVNVNTTVAVPDGGTVLMGGLKRLSEGRNEFGPPILSKIPYLNRLFKNTAYGRSVESLLLMVTPRIIVQAEEEERQTGYRAPPPILP